MMSQHGPERQRVASLMPPPPHGGHPTPMVRWKPGRLTQAKIMKNATTGLPPKVVSRIQRNLAVSTLSTAVIDATAKIAARNKLEGAVATSLRHLRATCERRELSRLLTQIDARVRDCAGRLIDIGMQQLLAYFKGVEATPHDDMPPIGHVTRVARARRPSQVRMAQVGGGGQYAGAPTASSTPRSTTESFRSSGRGSLAGSFFRDDHPRERKRHPLAYVSRWEERGLDDSNPPESDLALTLRRNATLVFPCPLLPIRTPIVVTSAAQLRPRMLISRELVFSLYSKAIGKAVLALQPTTKLAHQKSMQRLLERTVGNYYPKAPPDPERLVATPVDEVHTLRGRWRSHVPWAALRLRLDAAVTRSFEVTSLCSELALRERATTLSRLLTAEQTSAVVRGVGAALSGDSSDKDVHVWCHLTPRSDGKPVDLCIDTVGGATPANPAPAEEPPTPFLDPDFGAAARAVESAHSPAFDGLRGASAATWHQTLARVDAELKAASAWEFYVERTRQASWSRAGLLQLQTEAFTSPKCAHIGAALSVAQQSGTAHANALLTAARVHAHTSTHNAQRLLMKADAKPTDLASYVDTISDLRDSDGAVADGLSLPDRLERLYELLTTHGIKVPAEDGAYVNSIRTWAYRLERNQDTLTTKLHEPMEGFISEARAAADNLAVETHEVIAQAKKRGVYSVSSVAELTTTSADELARRLEDTLKREVPKVATWLSVLGQDQWVPGLAVVSIGAWDLRVCASAWHLLAKWRAHFNTLLSVPLVKLQARDAVLDAELLEFTDAADALGREWQSRCHGGLSPAAGSSVPTHAARTAQRQLRLSIVKVRTSIAFGGGRRGPNALLAAADDTPYADGALEDMEGKSDTDIEQMLRTRDEAEEKTDAATAGRAPPARVNMVQEILSSELRAWRRALPLVHQLLHKDMHSAQWQKVFANLPPPRALSDQAMSKELDDDVVVDEEAERKKAAQEMAKLRAPNSMCLRFLWETGLETFAPVIERVLAASLALH